MSKLKQMLPTSHEIKSKLKALPKWWWGIIFIFYIIGLILAFTVLIWLPGSTAMVVLIWIALVEWIQKKLSK